MSQPLTALGWSEFFADQLTPQDARLSVARIASVHRARVSAIGASGPVTAALPAHIQTGDFAVGDFILIDPITELLVRRLERKTLLQRKGDGKRVPQLGGANIDTLFIVTSANVEFNPARLERYLALANEAGIDPVIVLTKTDLAEHADDYKSRAAALQRDLTVIAVNARAPDAASALVRWCGPGQTVALAGSSGVGKSTLTNTLSGAGYGAAQQTGDIREGDAKGRHTTTSRSLHAIAGGGWVIDTPGLRSLEVSDVGAGLDMLFAEITELAPNCKFRDCTHDHEPGCAVQAAIAARTLDPERLVRWRKLGAENRGNKPARAKR